MSENGSDPSAPEPVRTSPPADDGHHGRDLIVGLVGAVGTDMAWVEQELVKHLKSLQFAVEGISINELISRAYGSRLPNKDDIPHDDYIKNRMKAGTALRMRWEDPAAVSLLVVEEIVARREHLRREHAPLRPRCAFVLRSLRRREEVELLDQVYRTQFVLVGCHAPRAVRIEGLADRIACSRDTGDTGAHRWRAEWLTILDQHEQGDASTDPETRRTLAKYGQRTRDTFPLADAYVNLYAHSDTERALRRFCDLVLGHPFISPSRDEFAMFHAQAAATRSTDLSRQVGAAIATVEGDIVAVGCNEVPRAGGGAYWEDDEPDARDFRLGRDGNQDQRDRALREIYHVLERRGALSSSARKNGLTAFLEAMDDTRVDGLIEFSRSVHAEMAALLDAARRGVSVRGAVLYTSTFPCHNCAKHIVAAGIDRVVFIEPYPKSLAEQLHGDSLVVDEPSAGEGMVRFEHFVGVAPTNYLPLFRAHGKRKDGDGLPLPFTHEHVSPKLGKMFHLSPHEFEETACQRLATLRSGNRPVLSWLDEVPVVYDLKEAPPAAPGRVNGRGPGPDPTAPSAPRGSTPRG